MWSQTETTLKRQEPLLKDPGPYVREVVNEALERIQPTDPEVVRLMDEYIE